MIGCLNSDFSGYGQKDAHELMTYLRNYLDEDLNRVKKKAIIETRD